MESKDQLTETITFRVTKKMRDRLEKAMNALGINSLSSVINFLLTKALKNLK